MQRTEYRDESGEEARCVGRLLRKATEVKSVSQCHRLLIALYSPNTALENGLLFRPPEKIEDAATYLAAQSILCR